MIELLAEVGAADNSFFTQIQNFFTEIPVFLKFANTHWQFCLLHFLEFGIWGAWIVVLGNLLNARGFTRTEIGRVYACMPIGSMVTPLFLGPIADNYVNTEVLIGVCHLLGGVLLLGMARAHSVRPFYWLTLAYALVFSPTLPLANSIVFAHDADIFGGQANELFPWIRVFGTLGWIAAGLSLALILKKGEAINSRPLILAAVGSFVLGAFAFTLPATLPSVKKAELDKAAAASVVDPTAEQVAQANAETKVMGTIEGSIKMLSEHPLFFGVTFIAAVAMGLYFAFGALFVETQGVAPRTVGPVMTIGQCIEIFFMLTLPWFLGKDNIYMNWVLLTGVAAWAIRFGLFAIGKPLVLVLFGVAIHGLCFDFFFVAGFSNADRIAPPGFTATAQALYGFLVYGLGMYLGSELGGFWNQMLSKNKASVSDGAKPGEGVADTNWTLFWLVPCVLVAISAALFFMFTSFDIPAKN